MPELAPPPGYSEVPSPRDGYSLPPAPAGYSAAPDVTSAVRSFKDTPYRWGGDSMSGSDCSGMVCNVMKQFGLDLPRTAAEQFDNPLAKSIKPDIQYLKPGDGVFFRNTGGRKGISHVAVYLGDGKYGAMAGKKSGYKEGTVGDSLWRKNLAGVRRFMPEQPEAPSLAQDPFQRGRSSEILERPVPEGFYGAGASITRRGKTAPPAATLDVDVANMPDKTNVEYLIKMLASGALEGMKIGGMGTPPTPLKLGMAALGPVLATPVGALVAGGASSAPEVYSQLREGNYAKAGIAAGLGVGPAGAMKVAKTVRAKSKSAPTVPPPGYSKPKSAVPPPVDDPDIAAALNAVRAKIAAPDAPKPKSKPPVKTVQLKPSVRVQKRTEADTERMVENAYAEGVKAWDVIDANGDVIATGGEPLASSALAKGYKVRPSATTPDPLKAKHATEPYRNEEIVQKEIDALEDKYESEGHDILGFVDQSDKRTADVLIGQTVNGHRYTAMPDDLAALYRERDRGISDVNAKNLDEATSRLSPEALNGDAKRDDVINAIRELQERNNLHEALRPGDNISTQEELARKVYSLLVQKKRANGRMWPHDFWDMDLAIGVARDFRSSQYGESPAPLLKQVVAIVRDILKPDKPVKKSGAEPAVASQTPQTGATPLPPATPEEARAQFNQAWNSAYGGRPDTIDSSAGKVPNVADNKPVTLTTKDAKAFASMTDEELAKHNANVAGPTPTATTPEPVSSPQAPAKPVAPPKDPAVSARTAQPIEQQIADQQTKISKKLNKLGSFADPTVIPDLIHLGKLYKQKYGAEWAAKLEEIDPGVREHMGEIREGVEGVAKVAARASVTSATGLANQVQARETELLGEVKATKGKSSEEWQGIGKQIVDDGASADSDFMALAERVGKGEAQLTGERVGVLLEGKRQLMNAVNRTKAALDASPGDKDAQSAYRDALARIDTYQANVQAGKGEWHNVGQALQAGTELDTGNFAEVIVEARRRGSTVSEEKLKNLTDQVTNATQKISDYEKRIAELEAQGVSKRQASTTAIRERRVRVRTATKAQLKSEWEDLSTQLQVALGRSSLNVGPKQVVDAAPIIAKMAKNLARQGTTAAHEIVDVLYDVVKAHVPEVTRQDIQDILNTRRLTERKAQAQEAIDSRSNQILSGKVDPKKSAKEPLRDEELDRLMGERDFWSKWVKRALEPEDKSIYAKVKEVQGVVRGIMMGSDIGTLARQGLFSWGRSLVADPSAMKALRQSGRTVFSEANMRGLEHRRLTERTADGRLYAALEDKHGLRISDRILDPEELSIGRKLARIPYVGPALERAQHTFINEARRNMFRRAVDAKWKPEHLDEWASFINRATGRGDIPIQPGTFKKAVDLALTSAQYEMSRWGMVGETFMTPVTAVRALKNPAARARVATMASTAAMVYGVYKLAELNGYKGNWDKDSPDFGKVRRGNDVWDITAGMAPRLRDTFRFLAALDHPGWKENIGNIASKVVVRPLSPALKTPIEQGSYVKQRMSGVGENDLKSPFFGFEPDDFDKGFWAWAPFIAKSAWEAYDENKSVKSMLWAGGREFIGTSAYRSGQGKKEEVRVKRPAGIPPRPDYAAKMRRTIRVER